MLLTPTLLQRTCNNFMVVEIWNRVGSSEDVVCYFSYGVVVKL